MLLTACGSGTGSPTSVRAARQSPSPAPTAAPSATPPSQGTLRILTFRGYMEWGGTDPRLNWVSPFERESGCRIARQESVQTAEEMERHLREGTFDVVSAPPEVAGWLIEKERAKALDTSQVEGYDDLPKHLRHLKAATRGDKVYGVPFLWSAFELMGRGDRPTSWRQLFTGGRVALKDSPMSIAIGALAMRDELGIADPFQLSERQLEQVVKAMRNDGQVYWKDTVDAIESFVAGGDKRAVLGQMFPYHRELLTKTGGSVRAAKRLPTTASADMWMMTTSATSPTCGYRWLSHMNSAKVQEQAAAWTGMAPANARACDGKARRMCAIHPAGEALRDVHFAVMPAKDCKAHDGKCADYEAWTRAWRDLVKPKDGS
ncbi:spermidine/putrescine ABC transporter substrate-binding protein [Sinosporangium siamense]|uniref:Spermidine/putrescine ABC transporter substrate-binding protein n=1 Tax=Sinosporangium siamense TaxID=1367973 RepID=A0A919RA17_9ACTN|nr:spermidine/putrescine ABC transporter substrate-binding protein [Sinosporangium siamense]